MVQGSCIRLVADCIREQGVKRKRQASEQQAPAPAAPDGGSKPQKASGSTEASPPPPKKAKKSKQPDSDALPSPAKKGQPTKGPALIKQIKEAKKAMAKARQKKTDTLESAGAKPSRTKQQPAVSEAPPSAAAEAGAEARVEPVLSPGAEPPLTKRNKAPNRPTKRQRQAALKRLSQGVGADAARVTAPAASTPELTPKANAAPAPTNGTDLAGDGQSKKKKKKKPKKPKKQTDNGSSEDRAGHKADSLAVQGSPAPTAPYAAAEEEAPAASTEPVKKKQRKGKKAGEAEEPAAEDKEKQLALQRSASPSPAEAVERQLQLGTQQASYVPATQVGPSDSEAAAVGPSKPDADGDAAPVAGDAKRSKDSSTSNSSSSSSESGGSSSDEEEEEEGDKDAATAKDRSPAKTPAQVADATEAGTGRVLRMHPSVAGKRPKSFDALAAVVQPPPPEDSSGSGKEEEDAAKAGAQKEGAAPAADGDSSGWATAEKNEEEEDEESDKEESTEEEDSSEDEEGSKSKAKSDDEDTESDEEEGGIREQLTQPSGRFGDGTNAALLPYLLGKAATGATARVEDAAAVPAAGAKAKAGAGAGGAVYQWIRPHEKYTLEALSKLCREMVREAVNADRQEQGMKAVAAQFLYRDASNRPDWWPLAEWASGTLKKKDNAVKVYDAARKVLAAVHGVALEGAEAEETGEKEGKGGGKK